MRTALVRLIVPAAMLAAAAPCGCTSQECSPPPIGYYAAPGEDFARMHRVAFVGLSCRDDSEAIADDASQAIFQALQARRLFQVDLVARNDPALEGLDLNENRPMTFRQMSAIRQALKCDGIILGAMSDFQQYPRMRMTVRLRMLDLRVGTMLWGVDQVWDTTDKAVAKRIAHNYHSREASGEFEPTGWEFAILSPRTFEKLVAYEIAQTLPCQEGLVAKAPCAASRPISAINHEIRPGG